MSAPLTVTTEFVVAYAGYSSISLGAAATEALCTASNNSSASFDIAATRKPKLEQTNVVDCGESGLVLRRSIESGSHLPAHGTTILFHGHF